MAKVYFVGMHNRPGYTPLDSRTHTGRVIDQVIARLACECRKTNLAPVEELPKHPDLWAIKWHEENRPEAGDIVVLLGKWAEKHFLQSAMPVGVSVVFATHPSAFSVRRDVGTYVEDLIEDIKLFTA